MATEEKEEVIESHTEAFEVDRIILAYVEATRQTIGELKTCTKEELRAFLQ